MGWVDNEKLLKYRINMKNRLEEMLEKNNRVAMQEPTGIGKSYMMIQMCKEKEGNKIIFEPTRVLADKFEDDIRGTNTEIMIYQNLLSFSDSNLKNLFKNINYIFLDEVHRIGAEKWGTQIRKIFNMFPDIKIIGLTATPIRTDRLNVFTEFFNDVQTEPMDLITAINEHLLPQITYVTAYASIFKEVESRKEAIQQSKLLFSETKQEYLRILDVSLHKLESIMNIPAILRKYIKPEKINNENFKVLLFVSRLNQINEAEKESLKWFNEAFPEKKINIYKLGRENNRKNNKQQVNDFENNSNINEIDIMISVNKLIEGFHIKGVSAAIFLRRTCSNIVFLQQIGRTLSESEPIIFDFVENHKNIGNGIEWDLEKFRKDIKNYPIINKDDRMYEPIIWLKDELKEAEEIFNKIKFFGRFKPATKYEIEYIRNNIKSQTVNQLAKNLNTDFYRIKRIIKELNLKAKRKPKFYLKQAIDMAKNGSSIEEILKETGLTRRQFLDTLKNNTSDETRCKIKELLDLKSGSSGTISRHKEEIIKLGKEGKNKYEIAEIIGFTYKQVSDYISHHKNEIEYKRIENNSGQFKPDLERQKQIIDFVENNPNMNVNQISKILKVSTGLINNALKNKGIKVINGNESRQIPKDIKEFLAKEAENKTIKELSEETGIKYDKIYGYLKRNKIKFKKSPIKSSRRKFSIEEKNFVISNFNVKTRKEIQKHLKCSWETLNNLLKDLNLI